MADVIDRDEFFRLVQEAYQKAAEKAGTHFKDIVQVVRCKDCLWWGEDEEDPSGQRQCTENIGTYWDANSFCSWGERKEDGKAD